MLVPGKIGTLGTDIELGAVFRRFGDTGPPGLDLIQGAIPGEETAGAMDHVFQTIWLAIG